MKNTLEDVLHKMGVSPEQIVKARELQEREGGFLRERLIEQGVFTQGNFAKRVLQLLRVPYMDLAGKEIPDAVLQLLPQAKAEKYLALPIELDEKHRRITIVMADPADMQALDELKFVIGHTLIPNYCPEDELREQIQQQYIRLEEHLLNAESRFGQVGRAENMPERSLDVERLLEGEQPILRLLGRVFSIACARGAHEIQLKAGPGYGAIDFVLHGKAFEFVRFPKVLYKQLISRLKRELGSEFKEAGELHATGFCTLRLAQEKSVGLSYQFYRSFGDEECLLKLKDHLAFTSLQEMGLSAGNIKMLDDALDARDGAILLSGTARSGLTSSLYGFLSLLDRSDRNILTIEAPVEYEMEGIFQGQPSGEAGSSRELFALRLVEQAPDVVMLDHVFDSKIADLFLQLASGSLVLSSLTASDSASAFMKLSALTSPELVLERVRCFSAQRIVRKICDECKELVVLAEAYREKLGLEAQDECYVGKGCEQCGQSGYNGLIPIFEFLPLTEVAGQVLRESQTIQECRHQLLQNVGLRSLRDAGMEQVRQGVTTVQEVIRTTIVS